MNNQLQPETIESNPMILSDMVDQALIDTKRAARLDIALKNSLADEYDLNAPLTVETLEQLAEQSIES